MAEVKASLMFHMPVEMKVKLEQAAKAAGLSTTAFVRNIAADKIGYTLPVETQTTGRKYATPEERQAAQKERDKERRALIKDLLNKYREANSESETPAS